MSLTCWSSSLLAVAQLTISPVQFLAMRASPAICPSMVLPKVDAFVTNGGYGSVNQALSFGVPLVAAGLTEDKADINVRVAWSGVGINHETNEPTPQALREAIRNVLDKPNYRSPPRSRPRVRRHRYAIQILRILKQVSGVSTKIKAVASRVELLE